MLRVSFRHMSSPMSHSMVPTRLPCELQHVRRLVPCTWCVHTLAMHDHIYACTDPVRHCQAVSPQTAVFEDSSRSGVTFCAVTQHPPSTSLPTQCLLEQDGEMKNKSKAEITTEKYGLEAGLYQVKQQLPLQRWCRLAMTYPECARCSYH